MKPYIERDNPILEFEEKMLKLKSLYQKHLKDVKRSQKKGKDSI